MRNIALYIPYFLFVSTFTFSTLFSIEYWPITNFSVFRIPSRLTLNNLDIYYWYYFDTKDLKWVQIPYRNSHARDSFSFSFSQLIRQNKTQEEMDAYVRLYLTGELKVQGIYKKSLKIKVVQVNLNYSSKGMTPDKKCFRIKDQKYCIYEEVLSEVVI